MGLPTRESTPPPYAHGNGVVENALDRIRKLAGSLVHSLSNKVGVAFTTSHPIWTWAMRHASWLINRFTATHGHTTSWCIAKTTKVAFVSLVSRALAT